jgi:Ricin-type beta-trefoil lectin domain
MTLRRVWVRCGALAATGLLVLAAGGTFIGSTSPGYAQPGAAPVPVEYQAAVVAAASSCPALTPARLAGQIMEESAFNPDATNGRGGRGLGGLTDDAWAIWRPNEDAARLDPVANIQALAHRTCDLVGQVRVAKVDGDLWELALGATFTDVATVKAAAGLPSEARDYVDRIVDFAAQYAQAPNLTPLSPPAVALNPPGKPSPTASPSPSPSPAAATSAVAAATTQATARPITTPPTTTPPTTKPPTTTPPAASTTAPPTVGALANDENGCLSATAALDGTHLSVANCDGSLLQRWRIRTDGRIEAVGLCMDAANAGTADWTPIQVAYCSTNPAQLFTLDGSRHIYSPYASKCVNINWDGPRTSVVLFSCLNQGNQKFTLIAQ